MPIRNVVSLWLFIVLLFAIPLSADWDSPSAKSYESVNGNYVFRITPSFGETPPRIGMCLGQLYQKVDDGLRLQWERHLINNVAPLRAYVANSGEYVVTIGEWGNFEELPAVFYGRHGILVNVHGRLDQLTSLRLIATATLEYGDWITNSLFLFGTNDSSFIIRMNTGDLFFFETSSGERMNRRWKKKWESFTEKMGLWNEVHANARKLIIRESLRLISSERSKERETGDLVLKRYTDPESVAALRQIAEHDEDVDDTIRRAAKLTIEKLEQQDRGE